MHSKIIIFDTSNEPFLDNRIFIPDVSKKYPGANCITLFYNMASALGYKVYTSDYAIKNNIDIYNANVITEIESPWTNLLVKRGAKLTILVCSETPSFAWKFYSNLKKITSRYKNSLLFKGTEPKVSNLTNFQAAYFPQPDISTFKRYNKPWSDRYFLTLLNSNQIRRVIKPAHILATLKDKSLKEELYSLRLKAIEFFHNNSNFHLYGRNWDKRLFGIPKRQFNAALKCYKGAVEDKVETLSNYKFTICFENAVFEGYITEKIFDCFYANSIPIYYGAPDICDHIPKECFIDFRNFKNFEELNIFLNSLSEQEFDKYITAINNFLESNEFNKFSEITFAKKLLHAIQNEEN